MQMCMALRSLEKKKVVHSDLHWENVAVAPYGSLADDGARSTTIVPRLRSRSIGKIFDWDFDRDR